MKLLGIDVGGSGIKGALVDGETGEMLTERHRISTPDSRKPTEMARVIRQLCEHFEYEGPVGCGFPTIVKNGVCTNPGNLDPAWVGVNVEELFEESTGLPFRVINDADAAGFASMRYGQGKNVQGVVVMITVGTGIGSGVFYNGNLLPNFELGQIPYKDYRKIEDYASNGAREREEMSYEKWGKRFNKFLNLVELLISPDLIIVGGGVSKKWDLYQHQLDLKTPVKPAKLMNSAGIIGAAASCLQDYKVSR